MSDINETENYEQFRRQDNLQSSSFRESITNEDRNNVHPPDGTFTVQGDCTFERPADGNQAAPLDGTYEIPADGNQVASLDGTYEVPAGGNQVAPLDGTYEVPADRNQVAPLDGTYEVAADETSAGPLNGTYDVLIDVTEVPPDREHQIPAARTYTGLPDETYSGFGDRTYEVPADRTYVALPNETYAGFGDRTFQIPPDGTFNVPADGTFQIPPDGTFNVPADGTFQIPPDGTFNVPADGTFQIPSDGTFEVPADGTYQVPGDGTFVQQKPSIRKRVYGYVHKDNPGEPTGDELVALEYLESKHIFELFTFMINHLLVNSPDNPLEFLSVLLEQCIAFRDYSEDPPLLFEEQHMESVYMALDPLGHGDISFMQYQTGMKTLGLKEYVVVPKTTSKYTVKKETFLKEAKKSQMKELLQMLLCGRKSLLQTGPHRIPGLSTIPGVPFFHASVDVGSSMVIPGVRDEANGTIIVWPLGSDDKASKTVRLLDGTYSVENTVGDERSVYSKVPSVDKINVTRVILEDDVVTLTGVLPTDGEAALTGVLPDDGEAALTGVLPTDGEAASTGVLLTDGEAALTGVLPTNGEAALTGVLPTDGEAALTGVLPDDGEAALTGVFPADGEAALTGVLPADGEAAYPKTEEILAPNDENNSPIDHELDPYK